MRAAFFLLTAKATGRSLFLLRNDGSWGLPGGREDRADIDLLDTACRELTEETGFQGLVTVDRPVRGRLGDLDYVTFVAEVPGEFRPRLDSEHWEYRWAFAENLAAGELRPLHPGLAQVLAR